MLFFFGLIQKQISFDAICLHFIPLKIFQWILKAFEPFWLRLKICNEIKVNLIYLQMYE